MPRLPGLADWGALVRVADMLAAAGQHEQAKAVARSIADPDSQA